MGRKEILEKRLARLNNKKSKLSARALASADVNEVRSLNEQIEDINEEIRETSEEIAILSAEQERQASNQAELEARQMPVTVDTQIPDNAKVVGTFDAPKQTRADEDPLSSMEYRTAFKNYVQRGIAIPQDLYARATDGAPTVAEDIGAIIPTTILNEFIKDVQKVYGQLYAKVRKLNIKGGVKVPISDLKANFKWISESTVSPRQNAGDIKDFVEFSYNIGEIRVSQTLLSSIVALSLFESEVVRIMVEAYVKAMDEAIVRGSGNGQMLGFLNDPRVAATGQVVELTAAEINNWTAWRKKLFAHLPLSRRGGEFIFPVSTVESYLLTMADSNNNPIFRQAAGINVRDGGDGVDVDRFFGREVTLVEPDIIPDFDTASAGDVIGVYWTPNDYAINSQMQFGMKRYFDEDSNQWVNKALTIVDGKMLDVNGMWLIKKK